MHDSIPTSLNGYQVSWQIVISSGTICNTFIPCADISSVNCQGAYLYFDNNRGIFVRSRKVAWQGFVEQHKEHMAESKKDEPESDFYFLYPSKHGSRSDKWEMLGHFKNLTQVVAAGFDLLRLQSL